MIKIVSFIQRDYRIMRSSQLLARILVVAYISISCVRSDSVKVNVVKREHIKRDVTGNMHAIELKFLRFEVVREIKMKNLKKDLNDNEFSSRVG